MKTSKKSYTYMLRCADNSLYTGYTTDINRREEEHNQGIGAKYTKNRLPAKMVYYEVYKNRSEAQSREAYIKTLSKKEKEKMVAIFKSRTSKI